MFRIPLPRSASSPLHGRRFLWPWERSTPVLMMHGFARNALFWDRWVPAVAETHRVYRPDLLGCGLSDPPLAGYRYTAEAIAAQIIAVLDQLSLPRVHWVNESSGRIIGLLLAAARPDRIASLVLCNTPTRIPDRIKQIYALDKANASEVCAPMELAPGAGRLSATGSTWSAPAQIYATGSCARWTARRPRSPLPCMIASRGVDTRPLLAKIAAPVLLLSGDKSPIAASQQQVFVQSLPNGRVQSFAGVGHGVNLLQPERCARAALEFWRGL